jgi:hypothetical protein
MVVMRYIILLSVSILVTNAYIKPLSSRRLVMLASHGDDISNDISPFQRLKRGLVGVSFAISSALPIFGSPRMVFAKQSVPVVNVSSTKSKSNSKPEVKNSRKSTTPAIVNKGKVVVDAKGKRPVIVEVEVVDTADLRNKQFTQIGVALVVASLLLTLVAPDDKSKRKKRPAPKPASKKSSPSTFVPKGKDDLEDLFDDDRQVVVSKSKSLKSFKSMTKLPEPEDLFDSADELFIEDLSSTNIKTDSSSAKKSEQPVKSVPAPAVVANPPAPKVQQEKKGFLDRIFQKPGGGRPTSLDDALSAAGSDLVYKQLVARALLRFAPGVYTDFNLSPLEPEDDVTQVISSARESSGMSMQEAAESFASIASAIMVGIVDSVVELSDDRKLKKEDMEKQVIASLDETARFIKATGELFGMLYTGISIEPVIYNGRVKRGKLENVYYIYAKASMNVADILSQANGEASSGADRMEDLGRVSDLMYMRLYRV